MTAVGVSDEKDDNKNSNQSKGNRHGRSTNRYGNHERFLRAELKIGGILGFKAERIDKRHTYEKFKDKLINYVGREFKNADDILPMLREGINPKTDFETKHLSKPLSAADANNEIKEALLKERIKIYIAREPQLKQNVTKLYNVVWGQCTDQLQSAINYQSNYEEKSKEKDVLWLLEKLQKETAGAGFAWQQRCKPYQST